MWLHVHWVFWGVAAFGFVAGLVWLIKHAKQDDLKKVMFWTLLVGVLGGVLTAPLARMGWFDMMDSFRGGQGWMMDDDHYEFMEKMMDEHFGEVKDGEEKSVGETENK